MAIDTGREAVERKLADDAVALAKRWESYGYPDCSGDCASANPPVSCCIMRETYDVSRAHAAHRKE